MAIVMAAITVERLAPASQSVARATGVGIVIAGLWMIARSITSNGLFSSLA
jgi:hypothetical protein